MIVVWNKANFIVGVLNNVFFSEAMGLETSLQCWKWGRKHVCCCEQTQGFKLHCSVKEKVRNLIIVVWKLKGFGFRDNWSIRIKCVKMCRGLKLNSVGNHGNFIGMFKNCVGNLIKHYCCVGPWKLHKTVKNGIGNFIKHDCCMEAWGWKLECES